MASTVKFVSNDLATNLTSTLPRWPAKHTTWQSFGSCNGADVILSTENGIKFAFHKVIVEQFTNIFDALKSASIEKLRDPFGSLVIILQGVEYETLQALSHLLYTGECHVNFIGGREALEAILAPSFKDGVTSHSWLSPALKADPFAEPPTTTAPEQEATEVQDIDEESPQHANQGQEGPPAEDQNVSFHLHLSDDGSDDDEGSTNEIEEEGPSMDRLESVEKANSEGNCDDECSTNEIEEEGRPTDRLESVEKASSEGNGDDECSTNEIEEEGSSTDRLESVEKASNEGNCDDERAHSTEELESSDSESQTSGSDADYSDTESFEEEVINRNTSRHNSKKSNKHYSLRVSDPKKKKKHRCELCNKGFVDKSKLERHQIMHSGEKPHQCKYCGNHFGQKGHLNEHERSHRGEKPFKCTVCGQGFIRKGHLTVHKRTHTSGEKPFKCGYCDKGFQRKGDAKRHELIHTGEKPYKCSQCNKEFSQSGHLIAHERIHTGEKPYPCSSCNKYFTTKSEANKHKSTHKKNKG